jgi:two-component system cell cycle response regulator
MSGPTVLVVDDSDLTRAVLQRYLSGAGFHVLEARDGAEAAVAALNQQPAVVVTDLEMPVMDGYQLARLLKNDPGTAHMPVVILTSHREATSRFWGEHAGADAYITKDELEDQLIETVRRLADRPAPAAEGTDSTPTSPLEVLARVARHLDEGLMDLTLINHVLHVGMENSSFGAAVGALLTLFNKVTDAELLGISVHDDRGLKVHLMRPPDSSAEVDLDELSSFAARMVSAPVSEVSVLRLDGEVSETAERRLEPEEAVTFDLKLRDARGSVFVWPRRREAFEGLPRELLVKAVPHAAIVLDNVRLAEHLWEVSTHDELTRLMNHRSILKRLNEEVERADRYETELAVILCDIDRFKNLNDTFGHLSGDVVLREIASRLAGGLRSSDAIGRYGGEEFLAVLPNADLSAATSVAWRICNTLKQEPVEVMASETPVQVTASFGVACLSEVSGARRKQDVVSLADSRLYEAKGAGRACVKP